MTLGRLLLLFGLAAVACAQSCSDKAGNACTWTTTCSSCTRLIVQNVTLKAVTGEAHAPAFACPAVLRGGASQCVYSILCVYLMVAARAAERDVAGSSPACF